MERAAAVKILGKMLGKSLGFRVDPKAPSQEEREAAKTEAPFASARRNQLKEQMAARASAILAADSEYQRLKAAYNEARQHCDGLTSIMLHYKITVGTTSSMFFHVRAQGDSWEQVIAKLTAEKAGVNQ